MKICFRVIEYSAVVAMLMASPAVAGGLFGGGDRGGIGIGADISIGGDRGVNVSAGAGVGRGGVDVDASASLGGDRGVNAGVDANVGRGGLNAGADVGFSGSRSASLDADVDVGVGGSANRGSKTASLLSVCGSVGVNSDGTGCASTDRNSRSVAPTSPSRGGRSAAGGSASANLLSRGDGETGVYGIGMPRIPSEMLAAGTPEGALIGLPVYGKSGQLLGRVTQANIGAVQVVEGLQILTLSGNRIRVMNGISTLTTEGIWLRVPAEKFSAYDTGRSKTIRFN